MKLYVLQNATRDGLSVMLADDIEELIFFMKHSSESDFKYYSSILFPQMRKDGAVGFVFEKVVNSLKLWTVFERDVPEKHDTLKKGYLY